jgi:hypothetical protein
MDRPDAENGQTPSGRRSFNLTATPVAEPGDAQAPRRFGGKSRRKLLIGASAAVPFVTTIVSRPVFAKTKGGGVGSLAGSGGGKKKKHGAVPTPGGDTVAMWQQNYPTLIENNTVEAEAFPATVSGNRYLANPTLAAVFKMPAEPVGGVAFTVPTVDLHAALHGRGTWEISVTHKDQTARRTMDGRYFAEATAAVLNAAVYGETAFGLNDAMVIDLVNRGLAGLHTKARAIAELKADSDAEAILGQLVKQVEGGFETRGETYYLAQMNARGTA